VSPAWFPAADTPRDVGDRRTDIGELGELEKLGIWDELIMKQESFP